MQENNNDRKDGTTKPTRQVESRTIESLEDELSRLDKMQKTNQVKIRRATVQRQMSQLKVRIKMEVLKLERTNNQNLIVYSSGGGFSKMIGKSALFYHNYLAKRIGRRSKLREDTDYYAKSATGVVSVRVDEEFFERLEKAHVKLDEKRTTSHYFVFVLPRVFTTEAIQYLEEAVLRNARKINEIVLPSSLVPSLYGNLNELMRYVCRITRRMPDIGKKAIGEKMVERVVLMQRNYILTSNGLVNAKEGWTEIYRGAISLKVSVATIFEAKFISAYDGYKILELTLAIERVTKRLIEKEKRLNAKKK